MAVDSYNLTVPNGVKDGVIDLPGSKSFTNRALIMASFANGRSTLRNYSTSDDSISLINGLKKIGIETERGGDTVIVGGLGGSFSPFKGNIDVGPAGTTYRFLTALLSFISGCDVTLTGSARMHARPIYPLVEALTSLGAKIEYLGESGCPPLRIRGIAPPERGEFKLGGGISSQYFTAILLVAPLFRNGLRLEVMGEQISKSYIDMTLAGMREFGINVRNNSYSEYQVDGNPHYRCTDYLVEGDASGASYLWGLAALSGRTIKVRNISTSSSQGDAQFAALLGQMGAIVCSGIDDLVPWIGVSGVPNLRSICCNMENMPDTAQTLAVVAACAEGQSRLSGLSTLTVKETDRIQAVVNELSKLGVKAIGTKDSLTIDGGKPLSGVAIDTYHDHRMAMSFAQLIGRIDAVTINDPLVVTKSFPTFWDVLFELGLKIS